MLLFQEQLSTFTNAFAANDGKNARWVLSKAEAS